MKITGVGRAGALGAFVAMGAAYRLAAQKRNAWAAVLVMSGLLLSGCAMTPNGRGGMLMSVDTAGIFGTEVAKFALRDGSGGTLRRDTNGVFSVKLDRFMRVVPLPNVMTARVAKVENIGQRTVVVIETQERNCAYRYEVLAIDGSDVLEWKIGNCGDRPRVQKSPDGQALVFDFPSYNQLSRQVYTDGRMLSSTVPIPPGMDIRSKPFANENLQGPATAPGGDGTPAGGRYIPAPPQRDDSVKPGAPAPASAPAATTRAPRTVRKADPPAAPRAPRPASSPATPAWSFSGEEVKATPIDLR